MIQVHGQQWVEPTSPQPSLQKRWLPGLIGVGTATFLLTGAALHWGSSALGADTRAELAQVQTRSAQNRTISSSMALLRLGVKSREAMQYRSAPAPRAFPRQSARQPRPTLRSYVNAATLILTALTPHRQHTKTTQP